MQMRMRGCMTVFVYTCDCVCACVRACVRACVFVREREGRERVGDGER